MNIEGIELHVAGDGPRTIVMIHGWPDTWRLWDAQVEELKKHYRCVRFSLPGFEPDSKRRAVSLEEMVNLLRRIVQEANSGHPVILFLHDWGCFFGYQFALRHPELVSRVIGLDVGDAGSPKHLRERRCAPSSAWLATSSGSRWRGESAEVLVPG